MCECKDMTKDIFEFRMYGEPHTWEGLVDIREISIEENPLRILIKMDGTNNKTKKREQIQFHMSPYTFERMIEGINSSMEQYKKLKGEKRLG